MILTEVPAVYRNFGTDRQEELRELGANDAEALLPELAEGSMRPKVEAGLEFARAALAVATAVGPVSADPPMARRSRFITR